MMTRVARTSGVGRAPPESVWEYPRPPRVEQCSKRVRVVFAGQTVAQTHSALRVLETSHPPTFYLPPSDVRRDLLSLSSRRSWCEWKGGAVYWTLHVSDHASVDCAWSYPEPTLAFEGLRDHIAFYPDRVDACFVDDEPVIAQDGNLYGGWITSEIRGPFKGGPGTVGW
jgi:uncharacterized protein (DUF427 family)